MAYSFQMFFSAIKFHEPNEFKVASNIRDTLNGFKQENNQPQKHWERGRGKHHHGAKINFDQQNAEKAREYVMNQIKKRVTLGAVFISFLIYFMFSIHWFLLCIVNRASNSVIVNQTTLFVFSVHD